MNVQKSFANRTTGILYLVPTPIGNLEDMTFRAVRILKEVDFILAEDTRNSIKLLNHFEITTSMRSYHQHSQHNETDYWLNQLAEGKQIALISDAGMPLINDPGDFLVSRAIAQNIAVVPLPGANAALTALVASGLESDRFTYYGFFPRAEKDQLAVLQELGQIQGTAIFYQSPHRLKQSLEQVVKHLGPENPVCIGRELTKRFEEFIRGTAAEVLTYLKPDPIKGECVLLIQGGYLETENTEAWANLSYKEHVELLIAEEACLPKEAIKEVAKIRGIRKQIVYNDYHKIQLDEGVE